MRNRWFHAPELHSPVVGKEKKVSWIELFYDLIFVAAIIQLGNALSHHVDLAGFLRFAGLFVPIWLLWTGYTFFQNRFELDDFLHRAMVFAQMFAVGAMAAFVGRVQNGHPEGFALAYAGARFLLALFYLRVWFQLKEARELTARWSLLFFIDAGLWLISVFVPPPWSYTLWALGIGVNLWLPVSQAWRELAGRYPPDVLHMSERYGLLTIIVLGESFVKVLSELAGDGGAKVKKAAHALAAHGADAVLIAGEVAGKAGEATAQMNLIGPMTLLITCCLWWIYFDDVAGSRIKNRPLAPYIWVYAHLPMTLAVTAVGVAIKKTLYFETAQVAKAEYRWLLCGALALALFSVGVIDWVTERRQAELSDRARVNTRIASAFFVLLLAPAGAFMPAWAFVVFVSGVCVAQVIFDLMMAPQEADPHQAHEDAQLAFGTPRPRASERETRPAPPRRDVSEAVRRGTPNELRRDLYFYLMEGSWARVFVVLAFLYLFVNVVFAALYMLEPTSVANTTSDSFLEAFFFSVQTMSTIGYGALSPGNTYGNILVTVEAAVAILGVALATGIMFAKASRPQASVLFSNVAVVTTRHGEPTLMFRVGNGRGNDVVDAKVNVSVLIDEVSPEGHKMRALYDLKLRRSNSPVFSLTWSILHKIDADSPLARVDWTRPEEHLRAMVVTLTGHDGTYAQTIYSRKMYYPEDFRFQERLVDVISELPDGRLMVDYTLFHDTEPDSETS
jgi:inward rectifier potassium channel